MPVGQHIGKALGLDHRLDRGSDRRMDHRTGSMDRRICLCIKQDIILCGPVLRSTFRVLRSILRSDPRSTPWSIPNGLAYTMTHMYSSPHPCIMTMISHPCARCAFDVLIITLSHSCISIRVLLHACVCPHSPASSQQCSSRCSQGGAS